MPIQCVVEEKITCVKPCVKYPQAPHVALAVRNSRLDQDQRVYLFSALFSFNYA